MAKKTPLEFWFDFSSPYAYIAATQIDSIAEDHHRDVLWRPFLLGAAMKESGGVPLVQSPMKMAYARHDLDRFTRLYGIPFTLPTPFPVSTVTAARSFYWIETQDPARAADFASVLMMSYFEQGKNIGDAAVVFDIAEKMGIDRTALEAAVQTPEIKKKLKDICDEAISRGMFGAPWVVVDGEAFWGADRLWMVEEWLESGGW